MNSSCDFLVELGTEELPPKALEKLSNAFAKSLNENLKKASLEFQSIDKFATPRRLAVRINGLSVKQADQATERKGPAVQAAFKEDGSPTPAALGFAKSCGVDIGQLDRLETNKGSWLVFKNIKPGEESKNLLPKMVEEALTKLPIPKRMRWGNRQAQFVRPVHWLVMLLGNDVIDCNILELNAGRNTRGHRFHHPEEIPLNSPAEYEQLLLEKGHVIADFDQRKTLIENQVKQIATQIDGDAVVDKNLLSEVNGLVEWPVAVLGAFDQKFLNIPSEALISAMKGHQKYFHIEKEGKLLANFVTISNIDSSNIDTVRKGNERVIGPRLSDAEFFWNIDRKTPLSDELVKLETVVFQNKLGTVFEKTKRVMQLSQKIAHSISSNEDIAMRAAELSKCDLMTEMVGEFPELQGIMGRYYALLDGEPPEVADAILEHYQPRFAGDKLPESDIGQVVSIADKLDTLVGIFSIGLIPTGDKDPFALRRATLGILRILIEKSLPIDLAIIAQSAADNFENVSKETLDAVNEFMMDRLKSYYMEQKIRPQVFDSVLATHTTVPTDFDARIRAITKFESSEAAVSLAAANKRINNILKKNTNIHLPAIDTQLFETDDEKNLYQQFSALQNKVNQFIDNSDYDQALNLLSTLKTPVDDYFDNVMVMVDDEKVRNNRLSMLSQLYQQFTLIADISRLS